MNMNFFYINPIEATGANMTTETLSARINENGRLSLIPENEAVDTVEKLAPAFKEAAEYMAKNRFPGILSNAK
jgi:hypothetical protein